MKKGVKAIIIVIALMIVAYISISFLLPFPYGLIGHLAVVIIGIAFLVQLRRKRFKFQQKP